MKSSKRCWISWQIKLILREGYCIWRRK